MLRVLQQFILTTLFAVFATQASAMFIQPDWLDPTQPGVGTNRYAYSGNDPINQRDPSGNSFLDWFSSQEDSDHQNQQDAAAYSSHATHLENQGVLENPLEEAQRQRSIANAREAAGWYQNRVGVSRSLRMRLDLGLTTRKVAEAAAISLTTRTTRAPSSTIVGSVRNVNPTGSITNCGNCVIATDRTLAGFPTSAMPQAGRGVSLQVLQQELGGQFRVVAGQAQIEKMMLNAGNGSRGVVGGIRANTEGHVFNVVNQNGTVRFLDGQTGGAATFSSDYVAYVFMRTN